jgi:hypothetical protein
MDDLVRRTSSGILTDPRDLKPASVETDVPRRSTTGMLTSPKDELSTGVGMDRRLSDVGAGSDMTKPVTEVKVDIRIER